MRVGCISPCTVVACPCSTCSCPGGASNELVNAGSDPFAPAPLPRYRYARAWWAGLLGSRVTLGLVFATLLSVLVFVLGFIPLASIMSADSEEGAKPLLGGAALHVVNGVLALAAIGLLLSALLGAARLCGVATPFLMPEPWCPAALCMDCSQGGGLPLCMELGAGECGVALAMILGTALLVAGVLASSLMLWQLLLIGSHAMLARAQSMVENIGEAPGMHMAGAGTAGGGTDGRSGATTFDDAA